MRHEVVTTIKAPADLVWDTVSAVERWPDWTPTVTGVQRLDDGPLRVGSRTQLTQPRQRPRVWVVTELHPGESFTWTSSGRGLHLAAGHEVRANDQDETVVTLTFSVTGVLAPLTSLLAGRLIRRYVDTEARSLKTRCERR